MKGLCSASPFQIIIHEYRIKTKTITTFQFFDEAEYEYVIPELVVNHGHYIVLSIGREYRPG